MKGGRQYQLLRELGTGTFGTVYHAEMQTPGDFKKEVAIKVLHPMWERHPDAARRFRDEARLLGQLRHRHLVKVDGLVRIGGRWAVVMEYVEGVDGNLLVKACRKLQEPWPVPAALEVCGAVASALDAAWHFQPSGAAEPLRVIHRDIKPSNIRLAADGDVKVLDFGIAHADFEGREALTQSIRYGSIRYMAPERRKMQPDSHAGDVYALGCCLFEFLLGRPFGNAETDFAEHTERVHRAMDRVRRRAGADADPIVSLLERMLHFDQDRRPAAAEVEEDCRRLARAIPGEEQTRFARRMIPRAEAAVGDAEIPVGRIVSSTEDDGSSVEVVQHARPLPRLVAEGEVRGRRFAVPYPRVTLPVATAGALVLVAFLAQIAGSLPARGSADLAAERVRMAAAVPIRPLEAPAAPPEEISERIPSVAFTVRGADAVEVRCVGASGAGTRRAVLRDVFAGTCAVHAVLGDRTVTGEHDLLGPGDVRCAASEGTLTCR